MGGLPWSSGSWKRGAPTRSGQSPHCTTSPHVVPLPGLRSARGADRRADEVDWAVGKGKAQRLVSMASVIAPPSVL